MLPLNFADGAARITGVAPQTGAANTAPPSPADGAATPSRFADVLKQKATAAAAASATVTPAIAAKASSAPSADASEPAKAEAPEEAANDSMAPASGATRSTAEAKSADAAKTRARTTGCIRTTAPQPENASVDPGAARSDDADPKAATADATAANAEALAAIKGEPPRLVPIKPDADSLSPVKGEPVKLVPIKVDPAHADGAEAMGDEAATSTTTAAAGNEAAPKGNDDRTEIGRRVAGRGGRGEASAAPAGKVASESASPFARALAEAGSSHRTERSEPMAAAAPVTPAPVQSNDAASTVSASVPVPIDSPEFAAALGLQVSVLANQGVEKAELHLNPAEMGPVSIAISLDGKEARVEFGADLAATRQAIEAGLPELASALRDAGFTLAGGGVSDQASQSQQQARSGDGDGSSRRGGGAAVGRASADTVTVSEPVRRAVARAAAGGVDLYA